MSSPYTNIDPAFFDLEAAIQESGGYSQYSHGEAAPIMPAGAIQSQLTAGPTSPTPLSIIVAPRPGPPGTTYLPTPKVTSYVKDNLTRKCSVYLRIPASLGAVSGECHERDGPAWIVRFLNAKGEPVAGTRVFALPEPLQTSTVQTAADHNKKEFAMKITFSCP